MFFTVHCGCVRSQLASDWKPWPAQVYHGHRLRCSAAQDDGVPFQQHTGCGSCNGQQPYSHRQRYHHLQQQQLRLQQGKQLRNLKQQHQERHQNCHQHATSAVQQEGFLAERQSQQQLPWYSQPHPEQLREILKLPPYRFQTLIQHEPDILSFQPHTLSVTLEALGAALHANHKAVVGILEERPCLLLHPHEPVEVLHLLAQLLQRSTVQTAFLLAPYPQLLSVAPLQLQQRIQELCEVVHWPTSQDGLRDTVASAGVSLLHLLATPLPRTAQQLAALAAALDTTEATCALLVQRQPHLLQMSPAVLRSRLFALAEAAGTSCSAFLQEQDPAETSKLASLLLLSPSRLQQQLDSLQRLLGDKQPGRAVVQVLLQLGPHAVADAQVKWLTLQSAVRECQPWRQELLDAGEQELGVLLTASHEALAQVRYAVVSGLADRCGMSLCEVVSLPAAEFKQQCGPEYAAWLAARVDL